MTQPFAIIATPSSLCKELQIKVALKDVQKPTALLLVTLKLWGCLLQRLLRLQG